MAITRVTSKGQVTIPRAVRSRMGIAAGDSVMFIIEDNRIVLVPFKRRALSELYGALPVTRRYPGREEERRIAQEHVARHVLGALDDADC